MKVGRSDAVCIDTDIALSRYNKTLNHGVCYEFEWRLQKSYFFLCFFFFVSISLARPSLKMCQNPGLYPAFTMNFVSKVQYSTHTK